MKKTSKIVIFFGNERLATGVTTSTPTIKALIKSGYTIAAIISNNRPTNSRSTRPLEIELFAQEHNIPILFPERPVDILEELKSFNASIGVLAAYGKIVPQKIIDIFPNGIINIHPSNLPLHRGPTPIESVILDGSTSTAVSIMKLVRSMDAGPIFDQISVKLTGNETKQELSNKLGEIGSKMIVALLPEILTGDLKVASQQEAKATYDRLILKDDGTINWNKPAIEIEQEIRAFLGWPGSKTIIANKDVLITMAHVVPANGNPGDIVASKSELIVLTKRDGLSIDRLKPSGKPEMDVRSFLSGYGKLIKDRL